VALISYGCSARSARHAAKVARERGLAVGCIKLLTLWPFPETQVRALTSKVRRIIVPEMNRGQMILEVQRVLGSKALVKGVNQMDGEMITPYQILGALEG